MDLLRNDKNVIIIDTNHLSCEETFETVMKKLLDRTSELKNLLMKEEKVY